MNNHRRTSLVVDPEVWERLIAIATAQDRSVSSLVRGILADWVDETARKEKAS